MKLGIVNQHASTGGWKYLTLLLKGFKQSSPNTEITVFYVEFIDAEEYFEAIKNLGIKLVKISPVKGFVHKKKSKNKKLNDYINKIRKFLININYVKNHKIINNSNLDVLFYAWPYNCSYYNVNIPSFFIPHDFIFTHFFGFHSGHAYTRNAWLKQREQLQDFADNAHPIVSSPYIAEEFKRTFPKFTKDISVVNLSSFNDAQRCSENACLETLQKYDIKDEYILYANNWALHKNMQPVIGAYYLAKQKYPNLKLIITGYGTKGIYCQCNTPYYLDHVDDNKPYDVKSLGLISDDDLVKIMQSAKMVINSSLCEAGSGSALDAWHLGTPVVMSEIEPFKQQLDFLGTKAELFNPRDSSDIAAAILRIMDNPELAESNVKISKEALDKYTWQDVAKRYLAIFEKVLK